MKASFIYVLVAAVASANAAYNTTSTYSASGVVLHPTATGAPSAPTAVPFEGGASAQKVGGLLMAVGFVAAFL